MLRKAYVIVQEKKKIKTILLCSSCIKFCHCVNPIQSNHTENYESATLTVGAA